MRAGVHRRIVSMALLVILVGLLASVSRAAIEVDVRGVEKEVAQNILTFLSLERYKSLQELGPEFVERFQERADREVRAAMRPFGFYEPVISIDVQPKGARNPTDYRVVISVTSGTPVIISVIDVKLEGPGASDEKFTSSLNGLPAKIHNRLRHSDYEAIKSRLTRTAATYGWLDARLTRSDLLVDLASHTAELHLTLDTGARYRFGETKFEQDVIKAALARRFLRYRPGDDFDATQLLLTQFALDDSQYFATVEVRPEDRDRDSLTVPVNITAVGNRRTRYQLGIGYGTDTDVRGTAVLESRRVNLDGHRIRLEAQAAAFTQSIDARYIVSGPDPTTEKFTLQLTGAHARLADIDDMSVSLTPSVTQMIGSWNEGANRWQRVSYVEILTTQSEFVASSRVAEQSLVIPGVSFSPVPRDFLGEVPLSRSLFIDMRASHETLGADAAFIQLRAQAERAWNLAPKWHLYLRGELGLTAFSNAGELAPSQRFFAGGDRSVRGFAFQELSPIKPAFDANGSPLLDEDGEPILEKVGARHLLTGSIELIRDLPRNLALAVFSDAGNAVDDFDEPMMYSVGIGIRFRFPMVSVGIDIAQPMTRPVGSEGWPPARLHLNLSPKF